MFPSRRIITSGGDVYRDQYSLAFDGTDDKVDLGSDKPNDGTGAITISAWVNPTTFGENSKGYIITNGKMFLYVNDTSDRVTFSRDGETEKNSADDSISTGSWQHIVVISDSDGDNTNFYINGALNGTANQDATGPVAGDTNTFIGNNNAGDRTFHGKISEVALWNTTLSSNQVKQLYNGREPFDARNVAKSNLQGYWRMGDGVLDHRQTNGLVADQVTATLGSELITVEADRTFASDTSFWSRETGVAISGGAMVFTNVGLNAGFNRGSLLTSGATYKVTVDCTAYTDGSLHVHGGTLVNFPDNTSTGTKTVFFIASSTTFQVRTGAANSDFSVDNISLKQVNGNPGVLVNFDGTDFKTDVPR